MPLIKELNIIKYKNLLKENGYVGDFLTDFSTRLINSTDNSIYELQPVAIAMPKNEHDVSMLLLTAINNNFDQLNFTARGGGTGTNGQSLSNSIIIDFSKYFNNIIEVNLTDLTVDVESGVVLDELNRYLAQYDLFFPPNISTADRATIGGMIATDAAGKGSLVYGKTSDYVINLSLVLSNGEIISNTIDKDNLNNTYLDIKSKIIDSLNNNTQLIDQAFLPLKRHLSGYNIKECYWNNVFNLNKLICGSEGSLGLVTKVKLKLKPIPKYKALVIVHYNNFTDCLNDSKNLSNFLPNAIETIDENVQKFAQSYLNNNNLLKVLNSENKVYISNYIELIEYTQEQLHNKINSICQYLDLSEFKYVVVNDQSLIKQILSIRSNAVGLIGRSNNKRKPVAFIEDCIVPLENLTNFVLDLQDLFATQNLQFALYGHVDVGCIHVRPSVDMTNPDDRKLIRKITNEVILLLKKYKGILWGEHGKGFRSEFSKEILGEDIYSIFCQIKNIFDVNNILNPGKMAVPDPKKFKLSRIDDVTMRGELDQSIKSKYQHIYQNIFLCNGNALCFNSNNSNIMCPSYKATKNRIYSPKGRAMLIKEWIRQRSNNNISYKQVKKTAIAVKDSLDYCLGCKGCSGKCPTQVNIPQLKSQFLNEFYKLYKLRDINQIINEYLEHLIKFFYKYSFFYKFICKSNIIKKFGFSNLPAISNISFDDFIKTHNLLVYNKNIKNNDYILIFVDIFSVAIDNSVLLSLIKVLQFYKKKFYITKPMLTGKALVNNGKLKAFNKIVNDQANFLNYFFERDIPVISLDNTFKLMINDEYKTFGNQVFKGRFESISSYINKLIDSSVLANNCVKYKLLPHCTEQSLYNEDAQLWKDIFNKIGLSLEIVLTGCCGMSGAFGYQLKNNTISTFLFKNNWLDNIKNDSNIILATGLSCRSQVKRLSDKQVKHPIEIISELCK